jgi:pyridoxal phosphate phosphatase PHOSPHO2
MAASGGGNGVVVVFDFDKTIIDCDSDNWVVDALGATARFDDLLCRLPWNSAIVSTSRRRRRRRWSRSDELTNT